METEVPLNLLGNSIPIDYTIPRQHIIVDLSDYFIMLREYLFHKEIPYEISLTIFKYLVEFIINERSITYINAEVIIAAIDNDLMELLEDQSLFDILTEYEPFIINLIAHLKEHVMSHSINRKAIYPYYWLVHNSFMEQATLRLACTYKD